MNPTEYALSMATILDINCRNITADRPPVLLAAGPVLLRPLGMAGIPAIVASSEDNPAFASRYCGGRCILPPRNEPDALIEALLDTGDRLFRALGRRVPLMYGEDYFLELIYMHRARFEEKFLLLLNDPEVALDLLMKDRFEALARSRDLPAPRSLPWDLLSEIEKPVLAKPRSKFSWYHSPLQVQLFSDHSKALIFENGRAAAADPHVGRFRDHLTFQEYVRGGDRQLWSFHGVADEHGKVLAWFVGRKLRTSPPLTGESSFIELIHDDALATFGRRMAEQVPLKGPFKMDFKTDVESGEHFLLEVNARFNLWHYLGAANGLNLMEVAYDYLVAGKRPPRLSYRTDTRWLCMPLDWRAYRQLAARRQLSLIGWLSSIVFTRTVYNVFAWSDPTPLAMDFIRKFRKLLGLMKVWSRRWLSMAC
jgi:D-aspartate ligase